MVVAAVAAAQAVAQPGAEDAAEMRTVRRSHLHSRCNSVLPKLNNCRHSNNSNSNSNNSSSGSKRNVVARGDGGGPLLGKQQSQQVPQLLESPLTWEL